MKKTYVNKSVSEKIENLFDIVDRPARLYPQKKCFRWRISKIEYSVDYTEFRELVLSLARGLAELGLAGKHIAIIGDKSIEWIASYFAVIRLGGVAVPLDRELSHEKVADFIEFSDAEAVIYSPSYKDVFSASDKRLKKVRRYIEIDEQKTGEKVICNDNKNKKNYDKFYSVVSRGSKSGRYLPEKAEVDKTAVIIFTSGTTGTSKGVMLSQKNICSCINQSIKYVDISDKDTVLSVLPLHHTYEMTAGILSPLFCGCTICLNRSLTAVAADMRYYRPTLMALVPLFIANIHKKIMASVKESGKEKTVNAARVISGTLRSVGIDLRRQVFSGVLSAFGGRLKKIICGGAALSPKYVHDFEQFGISLRQGYGITECSPVIGIVPYDIYNPASCGKLLEGMQLYIDRDQASDETGEICVKGDNVMLGYYKNEEATNQVLDGRGWFCTGDCGYIDEKGFIYITGRKKNVIVLENGKNVFPEEIEEYLENVEYIADCIVSSRKNAQGVHLLTAIIYPDRESASKNGIEDDKALTEFLHEKINDINRTLPSFKQIRNIELRQEPFPKTSTKKIQRFRV